MKDAHKTLARRYNDKTIHKRVFQKRDGRLLHLYGYSPHHLPPFPETGEELAKGGALRWHPLRQEWNLYAAHRQNRTFKPVSAKDPLAPTHEGGHVTEIPFAEFEIAVFDNKFTSLHPSAPIPVTQNNVETAPAHGACEVVVYTQESTGSLHSITQEQRRLLVATWIDRYEHLVDAGCKFVYPFENRGDEVGVTLPHPHGQIYGFSFIPEVQKKMARTFAEGFDLAGQAKDFQHEYGIAEAGNLLALCPPYARFPYETWIIPKKRHPGPWTFSDEEIDGFAHLLGDICSRYDAFFGRPTPYMLTLIAAPKGEEKHFHFTAQFYPILRAPDRVKYLASVEQGTGVFTVDVLPEEAAKKLRALSC